jgi:CDGSH-type Zn-finger protein/uncharacterized damage-inducible protein DinB
MGTQREILALKPIADDPEVGQWLAAMQDARRDTFHELEHVSRDSLDRTPDGEENSIGTLLYHLALVEADWLLADILGPESAPPWPDDLLPFADRDADGRLTDVRGTTLERHAERLDLVRSMLLDHLRPMSSMDFNLLRRRERWDISPAWVIHHLLQHEAEHRAQIVRLRDAPSALPSTDVRIRVRPNGSYKVYGPVSVLDPQDVPFDLTGRRKLDPYGERIKLCRCGASRTMPFCDDSHVETEFCSVPSAATPDGSMGGDG